MSQHDSALKHGARKWFVFPTDHPDLPICAGVKTPDHDPAICKKRGKHPAVKWDTGASTSDANITFWWSGNPRNIGIHCGRSGLLVIDDDGDGEFERFARDHGVEIPATYTVTTAAGKHYYFLDTEDGALGNREGAFGDYAINVRSGRGYVIAAGSKHESGITYTANGVADPVKLPTWVRDAIKGGRTAKGDSEPGDGEHQTFELPDVIKEGHRDQVMYRVACSLRAQTLNYPTAKLFMDMAWKRCEQPPTAKTEYPWSAALSKLKSVYSNRGAGRSEGYEPAEPEGRRLKITRASDITMTATRWLWEDGGHCWIPQGHLVGLGGREGVGKSTWCAYLAAKVTKGELPGDSYGKPRGVIIVSTEDDWSATIKPRLVAAGADLDRVFHVSAVEPDGLEGVLSLPGDLPELEKIIRDKNVALVILDPLLTLINKKLDTHKDAEVRQALGPMTKLAHDAGGSLVGLIHVNKSTEGDLLNRIMASRALTGVPRAFLFCAKYDQLGAEEPTDPDPAAVPNGPRTEFVFGQIKNNLAAKVAISLRYHMDTEIVGHDNDLGKDIRASKLYVDQQPIDQNVEDIVLGQEKAKKKVKSQRAKAEVWLVSFLAGKGEVPSRFVVKAGKQAGYSRDAIHGARRELEDRIDVINLPVVPRQTAWKLTPE